MTSADAWTFAANDGAGRPDDGWSDRARYTLSDFITLLWRERFLMGAIFITIVALGLAFALTLKTEYTANASILVKLGQEYVYEPRAGDAGRGAVPDSDTVVASEMEILGASQLHQKVIERIGISELYPKLKVGSTPAQKSEAMAKAVQAFGKSFEYAAAPDQPTIRLSFKDENPELAARVLNTLIDEYLVYRRGVLMETNTPAIQAQKAASEDRLAAADAAYQAFLTFNDIGDFDSERSALNQAATSLEQQRYTTAASLRERQGRLQSLTSQLAAQPAEIPVYRDINLAGGQSLDALRQKRAELAATYLPDSIPVRNIDAQIADLERSLAQMPQAGDAARRMGPNPVFQTLQTEKIQVTAEVEALKASLAAVTDQINQVTQRQLELSQLEPRYQDLQRERNVLQDNVKQFATREQESLADEAIARSGADNIRIVGRATPPVQGSSKRKLIAAAAVLFAGFTALCFALLKILLRQGLPTADAAGRTLDLPVLATARVKR